MLWLTAFFLGPLVFVAVTAFLSRGPYGGIEWMPTFDNLVRVFDPIYLRIFALSLTLACATTLACFAIGFPAALALAVTRGRLRNVLVFALAAPCLMSLVIRIYALKTLVGFDGPIVALLELLRIPHDPFALSQNSLLVLYGLVTTYLPFFVFPVYAALDKFEFELVEAARDLGAGETHVFFGLLLPNLLPAIQSGSLLVFIPALGEFVIPDLLGGARTMLIGNLITEQFLKARDWPFGAALGFVLLLALGATLLALQLFLRRRTRA